MAVDKKRVLITGVSGLLGNNLAYCLKDQYDILGLYNQHAVQISGIKTVKMDLAQAQGQQMRHMIKGFRPDVIIHCAALSDIDYCEKNQKSAYDTNVLGTRKLVESVKDRRTKFIYISTDAVYDNANGKPLCEEDPINPANYYGKTKYLGEQEALKADNSLILRTNIFGWNIQDKFSLAEWVIYELSCKREIHGFNDVYFSSIYTFDLAELIDRIIKKKLSGIYNLGSRSALSKKDFAITIADQLGLDTSLIVPISVDDFHFKAKRNKNLSLDIGKLKKDIKSDIPSINDSIDHFVRDFKAGLPGVFKNFGAVKKNYPDLDYISYGRQSIDDADIQAVINVLKSSTLTQGPKIREFEQELCKTTKANHAVAVNSGTSALHIACLAAGVGPGDEVITSPNSFVASANCAVYCGAKPVFADIDPQTHNICPKEIDCKITEKTKAIIPVHFAGQSCDMEAIREVVDAKEKVFGHKIMVIEDAAHALGSRYKGKEAGSCQYSDMAIMSFHPVKHITTVEGGVVLTNDTHLMKLLRMLRSHGITNDPDELINDALGPWYYEQQQLGFNYRITDVQCALGISQLTKLPEFIQRRRDIVNQYNEAFKESVAITTPFESAPGETNFHLYVIQIDFSKNNVSRSELITELKKRGITTQVHYIPIYTHPYYKEHYQVSADDYPVCENYYKHCLSIPLYPSLSDKDVQKVIYNIKELAGGAI